MTLREIYEFLKDDPMLCFIMVSDVARSIHQEEPATFDGCCDTALAILRHYETKDPAVAAEKFIEDLGPWADREIAPGLLDMVVNSD